jgi:hypothetical protein
LIFIFNEERGAGGGVEEGTEEEHVEVRNDGLDAPKGENANESEEWEP